MASNSADDRKALRPPVGDEITGRLRTQTGPRTTAPMWARPLLTDGEWAVYTAIWSFASWNGDSTFPSHQALADRAWVERGSAANAVRKFASLGMLVRVRQTRADGSDTSNDYMLVEVCPPALLEKLTKLMAQRVADQEAKRKARRKANRANAAAVRRRRAGTEDGAEETGAEDLDDDSDATEEPGDGAAAALVAALAGGGTPHDAPPGVHHTMHPGGTSHDGPGYTAQGTHDRSIDLPNDEQTIPRARAGDDAAAAAEPGEAVTRGGSDSLDKQTREKLNAAVDQVIKARDGAPGWDVPRLRRAVRVCLEAGDDPADVIAALNVAATDKETRAPGRLPHLVAAIVAKRTPPAPASWTAPAGAAQTAAEGPFRYVDNDRAKCRKHPGHPADNCAPCQVDARTAADMDHYLAADTPPPADPREAARAAAAAARARKEAGKPARVPRQAEPADPPPAPPADRTSEPAPDPREPEPVSAAA